MNNLFNAYGKITRWPKKKADKKSVIEFLAAKFIFDKIYTEKEVNGIIQQSLQKLKQEYSDLFIITDVCFCEYTDHGHCGVIHDDDVFHLVLLISF